MSVKNQSILYSTKLRERGPTSGLGLDPWGGK